MEKKLIYTKNAGSIVIHDLERNAICDIWYDESNEAEAEANAKKFIVSNDLLEALIELQNDVESWNNLFESDRIRITNAINKATK